MTKDPKFLTQEYFDLILSRGVRDFSGLYLNGLKAMGCDFSNAIFKETNVNGVDFRQSNFSSETREIFVKCYMIDVIFRRCDLSSLRFSENNIKGGQFQNTRLIASEFSRCDLSNSTFDEADLFGCVFIDCDLKNADFSKAFRLKEVKFIRCYVENIYLGQHREGLYFIKTTN